MVVTVQYARSRRGSEWLIPEACIPPCTSLSLGTKTAQSFEDGSNEDVIKVASDDNVDPGRTATGLPQSFSLIQEHYKNTAINAAEA